jgi:hypothetical protein
VTSPRQQTLSSSEIHTGRKLVRRFAALNGISVALLMDSVLILYAIRNGVGDVALAALASFVHLTMPFMILGKTAVRRFGAARTWGIGWFMRSVSALVMIAAPFVPEGSPQAIRTAIVLLGAFGFAAFRAIGLVGNSPVIGEITTDIDRGRFLSGNWVRTTTAQLVSLSAVVVILRSAPATWVFQLIIAVASGIGMYVGFVLSRVPETDVPRRSAEKPFQEVLSTLFREARMRKLLFAWASGFAAFTVVIPFAVITLKNGYGLTDHQALLFSLLTLTGGITASVVNGIIADRVGPRPLFVIYVITLGIIAAFWAVAPVRMMVIPTGVAFFLSGYCKFGILSVTSHYFLNVAHTTDRVGSALILRIVSGATAGIVGAVLGGGLLGVLSSVATGLDVYRMYFRVALMAFLVYIPGVVRLEKLKEWPVGSTAVLLMQPWRIAAFRRRK